MQPSSPRKSNPTGKWRLFTNIAHMWLETLTQTQIVRRELSWHLFSALILQVLMAFSNKEPAWVSQKTSHSFQKTGSIQPELVHHLDPPLFPPNSNRHRVPFHQTILTCMCRIPIQQVVYEHRGSNSEDCPSTACLAQCCILITAGFKKGHACRGQEYHNHLIKKRAYKPLTCPSCKDSLSTAYRAQYSLL